MAHPYFIAINIWGNSPTSGQGPRSDSQVINWTEGLVHSRHVGLTRSCVRIRVGRRADLRVKLPIDDARCFFAGQQVIALVPAEAVRLETGLFRRSRQHLNRWYGRIVLIEPSSRGYVITAKVHGESWALKCTVPIVGASRPPRTWDPVSIVVDPHAIELISSQGEALLELNEWECMRH
ncbi:MAG: hypothetical protein P0120_13130 [Nitrospira sp.]|nr:hypothetical protein [Nitrospira sp.]